MGNGTPSDDSNLEIVQTIEGVNLIRQTPVNGQSLRNLGREIVNGNTPKLGQAFIAWRDELTQFGVWVHALRSIDPKSFPHVTPPVRTTRSATIEDVQVAYDALVKQKVKPTKDALGAYLREHSITAGGTRLSTMKRIIEKQSAVRPPESAD